jgi:hypothetical protein
MSSLLFADDSNVFTSGPNLDPLQKNINLEMPKLVEWLSTNRLSLNIGKTHLMIFGAKKSLSNNNINIKINNQALEIVTHSKFLGIMIDNKLSWKEHALYTSKKLSKSIARLSLAKKYLNKTTMIQLYYSFIFPYLYYCNLAWGNAADTILWPIFRNQKLALRIISNTPRRSSTIDFCKNNQIFRLPDIHKFAIGLFMFKYKQGLLPEIFSNFFSKNQDNHSYQTRNATKLRTHLTKTQVGTKFIKNTGISSWNQIESTITSNVKIGTFKNLLKKDINDRPSQ